MSAHDLKSARITLYEKDGEVWVKLTLTDCSGEQLVAETELDTRDILVCFDCDEEDDASTAWERDVDRRLN